jgi:hypothetical protein
MGAPRVEVDVHVHRIDLKPGQSLTVWLDREPRDGYRDAAQVELRVRPDGVREVFCDADGAVSVRRFDDWEAPR